MNAKNILISLLIVVFIMTSCDDKLELNDPNSLTTAEYWKTEEHMAEAVIGVYQTSFYITAFSLFPGFTDGRADDVFGDSGWVLYPKITNFTVQPGGMGIGNIWSIYYQGIFRANQVLDKIDDIEFADQDYKNRLKGQALFWRGYCYFHLVFNFDKVPLILTLPQAKEDYYPSQSSAEEVYAQVEADLTTAASLLPKSYEQVEGPDAGQKGRVTWGSATGMLAKVLMQQNKIAEAKPKLKEIIDSKQYALVDNYFDNFTYSNENNEESLFELQFGILGTAEGGMGAPQADWRQANGINYNYGISNFTAYEDFEATEWFYNEFYKERTVNGRIDPRCYFTLVHNEPEYDTELYDDDPWGRRNKVFGVNPWTDIENFNASKYYIAKYTYARIPDHSLEGDGVRGNSKINYRVLRYADILLLYAECINETEGATPACYNYIQEVRDRVNLPDLATVKPGMSQEEMREQIYHERALELGVEANRWLDIRRWGWLDDPSMVEELKARDPHDYTTYVGGKEYYPIPQSEMDVNPNLEPNINH